MSYVFLLGGRDLEMCGIERLLKQQGRRYHWKDGVTWGNASWSIYADEIAKALAEGIVPVGIELTATKEATSKGCISIDHHNEHSHKPSSIEQVAELLGVALSPFEQAVATNDKGHIKAMRTLGLSEPTIMRVRKLDRRAQGHTVEQDEAAKALVQTHRQHREIRKYPRHYGDVDVIDCGDVPFSCAADHLRTNKMLLWNKNKLMYAGPGVEWLKTAYADMIADGRAYTGGNPLGFFGTAEGQCNNEEIAYLVEQLAHAMKAPFSHHIFLYPFKWSKSNAEPFGQVKELIKDRIDQRKAGNWQHFDFAKEADAERYNEFQYFHPFARIALFNHEKGPIACFRWKEAVGPDALSPLRYGIEIVKRDEPWRNPQIPKKPHELELEEVTLTIYESGVGVLGFHLNNRNTEDPEDVLDINDFGRRLWPPFQSSDADRLETTRKKVLADRISLFRHTPNRKKDVLVEESFTGDQLVPKSGPDVWTAFRPAHVRYFLDKALGDGVERTPAVDDRMFTLCWFGNDAIIRELRDYPVFQGEPAKAWRGFRGDPAHWWYRFVFVDNRSAGIGNRGMLHRLNAEHCYPRFIGDGSVIGMSRYSFVLLSDRGWFGTELLRVHVQTMYFQMVQLCLAQRASILRFSEKATEIARLDAMHRATLAERLSALKADYIRFVNRIWFREVSPQEQGIELYEMLQAHMDLDKHVKDLNGEIEQLHQFALLENARAREDKLDLITKLGFYVAIPTLITGFFGMNFFSTDAKGEFVPDLRYLALLLPALLIVLMLARAAMLDADEGLTLSRYFKLGNGKVPWWFIALAAFVGLIIFFPLLFK